MKVVVIIPTYNEKENIERMIDVLEEEIFPKIKSHQMEILVVDDKSPDGTAEVVREKMKRYSNITLSLGEKQGLGAAYKRGMKYAMANMGAEAVIEFDADFQHDPKYIIDLLKKIDEGYDYVIGSRFVKGGSIPKGWSFYRKFLTKYGGLFSRFVLFFPNINRVRDVTTGLKLTRVKNVLDKVDFSKISSPGFYYKTQMLYQIVNMGAKVVEIPIHFKLREKGETKMSFSNVVGTFWAMIVLRLSDPKTIQFIRFCVVGFSGYIVNAVGLELFYRAGLAPGPATAIATEIAVISNFTLNNFWTFSQKKIVSLKRIPLKFIQFNLTALGIIIIATSVVWLGTWLFGDQWRQILLFFTLAIFTIPYSYFMYSTFIWKTRKSKLFGWLQKRVG